MHELDAVRGRSAWTPRGRRPASASTRAARSTCVSLQAVLEDAAGGRPRGGVLGHVGGVGVRRLERDEGGVAVTAAGEADVEGGGVGAAVGDDVAAVDGGALGGVHGRAVGELDVLPRRSRRAVRGRRRPRRAPTASAVLAGADDAEPLPVDDAEVVVVLPGHDLVADAGEAAGPASGTPSASTRPAATRCSRTASARRAASSLVSALTHDGQPGDPVGGRSAGGRGDGVVHGLGLDEAAVPVVVGERVAVAVPQPQRRRGLPVLGEAADVGQRVGLGPALDQAHRAAGADGAELARVAHEHQPGADRVDDRADPVELAVPTIDASSTRTTSRGPTARARSTAQGRPGLEPVLRGEPRRDVGAVGDAVLAQDLGGVLRDGQAVHPAAVSCCQAPVKAPAA